MEAWNIGQLKMALINSLTQCHTQLERDMCKAIAGKEIREKAILWSKTRKLTPGEIAIASEYGYRQHKINLELV